MQDHFYTIEKPGWAEYKESGSRFIAWACSIEDAAGFREKLATAKKEYVKATHY